jgi:hypothetical protein
MFQTVWIWSINNFNVVSQLLFLRSLIYDAKNMLWVFVKLFMRRIMIDFKILFNVFNKDMNLYVLTLK